MRLLLHAITPLPESAAALGDFRAHALTRIDVDQISAWATPLSEEEDAFTRDDLLAHHRQVEAIFAHVESILPAQFATLLASEDELCDRLTSQREPLLAQLERVRGSAELAVTALWMGPDGMPPNVSADTPGRRYLLERQARIAGSEQRQERARQLARELEHEVGPEMIEARHTFCPSEFIGLSSALLVRRWRAVEVRVRLVRPEQDVRILVNGPWPPYTFAAVGSD